MKEMKGGRSELRGFRWNPSGGISRESRRWFGSGRRRRRRHGRNMASAFPKNSSHGNRGASTIATCSQGRLLTPKIRSHRSHRCLIYMPGCFPKREYTTNLIWTSLRSCMQISDTSCFVPKTGYDSTTSSLLYDQNFKHVPIKMNLDQLKGFRDLFSHNKKKKKN